MQYNSGRYNEHQYNTDFYSLLLSDSLAPSDSLTKYVFIVKLDSSSLSDSRTMSDTVHNLLETITSSDVRKMLPQLTKSETVILSDVLLPFSVYKALSETVTLSSVITFDVSQILMDFIFFSEYIKVEITNKALNDTIRINDWLSIQKSPVSHWHD
jgi:hypothetical protein